MEKCFDFIRWMLILPQWHAAENVLGGKTDKAANPDTCLEYISYMVGSYAGNHAPLAPWQWITALLGGTVVEWKWAGILIAN